jgi:hypothetical protein
MTVIAIAVSKSVGAVYCLGLSNTKFKENIFYGDVTSVDFLHSFHARNTVEFVDITIRGADSNETGEAMTWQFDGIQPVIGRMIDVETMPSLWIDSKDLGSRFCINDISRLLIVDLNEQILAGRTAHEELIGLFEPDHDMFSNIGMGCDALLHRLLAACEKVSAFKNKMQDQGLTEQAFDFTATEQGIELHASGFTKRLPISQIKHGIMVMAEMGMTRYAQAAFEKEQVQMAENSAYLQERIHSTIKPRQ